MYNSHLINFTSSYVRVGSHSLIAQRDMGGERERETENKTTGCRELEDVGTYLNPIQKHEIEKKNIDVLITVKDTT